MLPEALSNHWCSLVPREDRPVLVAEMSIDADGQLKRHRFHRAMMRSAARLTYTHVQRAIDGTPDAEIRALDGERDPPALRRLQGPAGGAPEARRARSRPAGAPGHARHRRAHCRDRRARAARQPPADRGVHGAGQRGGSARHWSSATRPASTASTISPTPPSSRPCASSWALSASLCRPASGCARPINGVLIRSPASRFPSWSARPCCAARARPSTAPTNFGHFGLALAR